MQLVYKACIAGQKGRENLYAHGNKLVAGWVIMMYVLYLYITRTVLDVFNCGPVVPDDGKKYLQVVFEECGVKGGTQMKLLGWAWVAMFVYVIGYPLAIGYVLWNNWFEIMYDQILRAKGWGYDANSSTKRVL